MRLENDSFFVSSEGSVSTGLLFDFLLRILCGVFGCRWW
jgi:hypothetical protein